MIYLSASVICGHCLPERQAEVAERPSRGIAEHIFAIAAGDVPTGVDVPRLPRKRGPRPRAVAIELDQLMVNAEAMALLLEMHTMKTAAMKFKCKMSGWDSRYDAETST